MNYFKKIFFVITFFLSLTQAQNSCEENCGGGSLEEYFNGDIDCVCSLDCAGYGDACCDYYNVCYENPSTLGLNNFIGSWSGNITNDQTWSYDDSISIEIEPSGIYTVTNNSGGHLISDSYPGTQEVIFDTLTNILSFRWVNIYHYSCGGPCYSSVPLQVMEYGNGQITLFYNNGSGPAPQANSIFLTLDGWMADSIPEIEPINNILINEDSISTSTLIISSTSNSSSSCFVESDTSAISVQVIEWLDNWRLIITPQENWFGDANINVIVISNQSNLSDSINLMVTVLPVNDAPQDFALVFPTITDTIQINTDTDETITFAWEESVDIDSDVTYLTTVTLDYFGSIFTQEYEGDTSSVSITGYEWAVLMTNQNLDRWTLQYNVKASDEEYEVVKEGEFVFQNTSLSVDRNITPLTFNLYQNYPNPFNPITTLKYDLPEDSFVDVTVYDMLGNVVNNLVNKNQNSGSKLVQWDATNNQGELVSAGVYLYKIKAGDFSQTRKMILLK